MTMQAFVQKTGRFIAGELRSVGFSWRATIIVAWAAVALTLPHYHTGSWYWEFLERIGGSEFRAYIRYVWLDLSFWLQFGGSIALILLLREPLRSYGLGLGNVKLGIKICLVFYVLYVPLFIILFLNAGFQEQYSVVARNYSSWREFVLREPLSCFFFMVRTEFLFRGFLLFGIKKQYGSFAAILLSLIPFVMVHFDKPEMETLGAFPVGLALAFLAIRTESIWYGVFIHGTIALLANTLIIVTHGFQGG